MNVPDTWVWKENEGWVDMNPCELKHDAMLCECNPRQAGYYWLHNGMVWLVGRWIPPPKNEHSGRATKGWVLPGGMETYDDNLFTGIGPRIPEPENHT